MALCFYFSRKAACHNNKSAAISVESVICMLKNKYNFSKLLNWKYHFCQIMKLQSRTRCCFVDFGGDFLTAAFGIKVVFLLILNQWRFRSRLTTSACVLIFGFGGDFFITAYSSIKVIFLLIVNQYNMGQVLCGFIKGQGPKHDNCCYLLSCLHFL